MGALCCMSEDARAAAIMEQMTATQLASIDGKSEVVKAIGTAVSLEGKVLMHPFEATPVVWYECSVWETRKHKYDEKYTDAEGNEQTRQVEREEENLVYFYEAGAEFLLCDGKNTAMVDIRNKDVSKISSRNEVRHGEYPKGQLNKHLRDWCYTFVNKNHR
jgi:hypothetical protein